MITIKKLPKIFLILILAGSAFSISAEEFQIALASFTVHSNANAFIKKMKSYDFEVEVEEVVVNNVNFYRILSSKKHNNRESALHELRYIQGSTILNSKDSSGLWLRSSSLPSEFSIATVASPEEWIPSSPLERSAHEAFIRREDPSKGLIAGKVLDSLTGQGLSNVDVYLDAINESTLSDIEGIYKLQAPVGKTITLNFEKSGYTLEPQTIEVLADRPSVIPENRTVANLNMETGEFRMVLTWGEKPYDLDSHLLTPSGEHIYFGSKNPINAGAYLDTDDIDSFGPETITIETQKSGTYIYLVHNYSEYPRMVGTEACVKVYSQEGLIQTIKIPSEGTGDYWVVGILDDEGLKLVNTLTDDLSSF